MSVTVLGAWHTKFLPLWILHLGRGREDRCLKIYTIIYIYNTYEKVIAILKTIRERGIRNVEGRRGTSTVLIDLGRPPG